MMFSAKNGWTGGMQQLSNNAGADQKMISARLAIATTKSIL